MRLIRKRYVIAEILAIAFLHAETYNQSLILFKQQFKKQLKAKDEDVARIQAAKYKEGRALTKKITLLEDEVDRMAESQQLLEGNLQHTVGKAVRVAKRSERKQLSRKHQKLKSKLNISEKEKSVSDRGPRSILFLNSCLTCQCCIPLGGATFSEDVAGRL